MTLSPADRAFFDWLDEAPCTSNGVLVQTARGETRNVPRGLIAQEFRARTAPSGFFVFGPRLDDEQRAV